MRSVALGAWRASILSGCFILCSHATYACGSPRRAFPPRPSLLEPERPRETARSPAEWRYHPRKPARLSRTHLADDGASLSVGALGERWLVKPGAERAEPAALLAPETLIGVLPGPPAWTFVGESGATYVAESPLGNFVSSSAPLERLARVDAGPRTLVAVSRERSLLASDDAGLSWRPVGPREVRFADVLVAGAYAFALAIPERLWWAPDAMSEWRELEHPPFGAERLARDREVGPLLVAASGTRRLSVEGDSPPRVLPLGRAMQPEQLELPAPPREGPSARAIALRRAFTSEQGYFELDLGVKAASLSGELAGPLIRSPLPDSSACHEAVVAGAGNIVFIACSRERTSTTQRFDFFRSEDAGRSFEREPYTARGSLDDVRLAVAGDGSLLVTGICPAREVLAGCRPHGIQMRRSVAGDAGASLELTPVPAPALEGNALALAFSADGVTAYAIGRRTKSDDLFAFVAADLDQGFKARPLLELGPGGENAPNPVQSLTASVDGQLSLVIASPGADSQLLLLDADGRLVSSARGPLRGAVIGAYGARALAVSRDEAWESLDGGARWQSVGALPTSPCASSQSRCSLPVHCHRDGCAVGDNLSRIGWRGQARASSPALLRPAREVSPSLRRAIETAFACELSSSEWKELDSVQRLPDAAQAAIGNAAWYALASDDASASAGLWIAERDARAPRAGAKGGAELRYSELLRPSERASEFAYHATLQVEGAAALRYALPRAPTSKAQLAQVEVAWDNLQDDQRKRAVISDAGALLPGDFVKGEGAARRAQPDLLSIASGGIYVRVHRQPGQEQPTYFLDGSGVEILPALIWSPPPPKGASSEMVRLGKDNVALSFVNRGATVARAVQRGQGWRFDAMTIGYADGESFGLRQNRDIAYARGRVALHMTTWHGGRSEGELFPLQAQGPLFGSALAAPTQGDLRGQLPRCSEAQRSTSPRIVAPFHPGARRPVFIHDPVEPLRVLLTDLAILHGSRENPCIEVFDAEPVRAAPGPARERALLNFDVRGSSWLFRAVSDTARRDVRVEYRPMTCRPDPDAEVPSEIFEAPGTRVERSPQSREAPER